MRHGDAAFTYAQFESRCRRLASALARRGIGRGDTVAILAPNVPAMLEAHYAVPGLGRGAQRAQLPARRAHDRLLPRARRRQGADRRPRVLAAWSRRRSRSARRAPLVIDIDDPLAAGGALLGEITYEALLEEGDPAFVLPGPRGRVGFAGAPLHLGHDGRSQGRGLPPPRRLPQRAGQRARLRAHAAVGLPVDAADVPLQRLDLHLGRDRGGRHPRLPAQGRSRRSSSRPSRATASRTCAARRSC